MHYVHISFPVITAIYHWVQCINSYPAYRALSQALTVNLYLFLHCHVALTCHIIYLHRCRYCMSICIKITFVDSTLTEVIIPNLCQL